MKLSLGFRNGCALPTGWLAGIALILLLGCASPARRVQTDETGSVSTCADGLAQRLRKLSPSVDAEEARRAAWTACQGAADLARQYRAVWPPFYHNILVNTGRRERGLCFHWADDLAARLDALSLRTLELHRAVARLGTRREHSSVVLTAVGQPFETGIVLDAWRRSGHLYWGEVSRDRYPWIRVEIVPGSEPPGELRANRQTRR